MGNTATLYDTDFYGWTRIQAATLRAGNLEALDVDHLIEEIESMGRSEQRALESRLEVLLAHLLKWRFQPDCRSTSWRLTVIEQRRKIARLLRKNPGLAAQLAESLADAYGDAILAAIRETGRDRDLFPPHCPWTFAEVVDDAFWPDAASP